MRPFILTILLLLVSASNAHAQTSISAEDAQRDLRILKRGLTELHPGLYRYLTAEALDAEFVSATETVANGTDRAIFYLLVSRIAASVRCGHTWTNFLNQSEAVKDELFERADKLPITLRLVQKRFLIDASAVPAIEAGSELLSIDEMPPTAIVKELMPYLRADGSSDGKRIAQIDHGENGDAMDRLYPLLHPPVDGHYRLRIRDNHGEHSLMVSAMTAAQRSKVLEQAGAKEQDDTWTFAIDGDTALMTLPTFAFWKGEFDWKSFLANSFSRLNKEKIPNLIIDIRRNEGGDDAIGMALLSRLLHKAYTQPRSRVESAYERVPYILARYLDTWDFSFFDRTDQVVKGPGRNWILREQPAAVTIEPASDAYAGDTIVLIGPDNSSAGYLLARDIKASGAATLIGQTTGGNLRGLNGGQLAWMTLPASGVAVDIPLIAAMPMTELPDAGVTPDMIAPPLFDDAVAGIDSTIKRARQFIERRRAPHQGASTSRVRHVRLSLSSAARTAGSPTSRTPSPTPKITANFMPTSSKQPSR